MNLHTLDLAQAPTETLTRGLRCQDCFTSDGAYDLRFNAAAPNFIPDFAPGFAEAYAERFRTRPYPVADDCARAHIQHRAPWGNAGFLHCTFEDPLEVLRKDFGARRR